MVVGALIEENLLVAAPSQASGSASLRRVALVRLVVLFVVLLAADVGAQMAKLWAVRYVRRSEADWVALVAALLLGAVLAGIYVGLVRAMERRQARELAPSALLALNGTILGVALFSTVFGLLEILGFAKWQGLSAHYDGIPILAAQIVTAIGEELAFRGGVFRVLEDSLGTTVALAISACIFGLLHGVNPGATLFSTVAIALEAGVLLGAAYALTRNLWFPIGVHFGWNFAESGVFGTSVSGFAPVKGFFAVSLAGPRLLSGGKFGPEASVIAIAVCLLAAAVLIALTIRKGRWRPRSMRMMLD